MVSLFNTNKTNFLQYQWTLIKTLSLVYEENF